MVGRSLARIVESQPARRSSPMGESLRQPIHAIRVWPRSMRCWVASAVPAAPSTSTQTCRAPSSSHGRPNATNGRPLLAQPGGLRVAEVGVGDDEGVDGGRAQQVVVAADRVLVVAREEQDVVAGLLAGLDERVHEPVHHRVGGALLGRGEAEPDQRGRAGAQVARGPVGRVAELGDGLPDPLEGVGTQQVGVVDRVGDRLARDAGALGDVGEGRRRHRQLAAESMVAAPHVAPLIDPTSPSIGRRSPQRCTAEGRRGRVPNARRTPLLHRKWPVHPQPGARFSTGSGHWSTGWPGGLGRGGPDQSAGDVPRAHARPAVGALT